MLEIWGSIWVFNLFQGRVNKNIYNSLMDNFQNHMAAWNGNLLNKVGRIYLAKSVTSSISIYSM